MLQAANLLQLNEVHHACVKFLQSSNKRPGASSSKTTSIKEAPPTPQPTVTTKTNEDLISFDSPTNNVEAVVVEEPPQVLPDVVEFEDVFERFTKELGQANGEVLRAVPVPTSFVSVELPVANNEPLASASADVTVVSTEVAGAIAAPVTELVVSDYYSEEESEDFSDETAPGLRKVHK